ncbi:sensor histidine kinase [Kordiimonas sediminis]|uniref:histidine kinase n=1 Tax=Kordiimonas sediminis TaxID=1735581 RepID=A0A919APG5_9PROT|nr:ATP-binding protein [Kordiimonas sediminis]GHF19905.1 sensor histidine kinase [Kordiimonas sediminis]
MGFKRFSLLLVIRQAFIIAGLAALVFLISLPGYHAATLLVLIIVISLTMETYRFISKTNAEVNRFLDAARYADFGQRFNMKSLGAGFDDLGETFTAILDRFRDERTSHEEELRHLKALIEHVPVPLISLHANGSITVWNNSARRLFGTVHVTKVPDLGQFGEDFAKNVTVIKAGERRLVDFEVDGMAQNLTISATQIIIGGHAERLISLLDIRSELDVAQLQAWQDLVRVLTHEIMNSITPVASLAKTSADLVDDVRAKITNHPDLVEDLDDVHDAVKTVARRSDALMNFVQSYRRLTRLPAPEKSAILLSDLFGHVANLVTRDWEQKGIALSIQIAPSELDIIADRNMLEQVLINILQNAEQALTGREGAIVTLGGRLNKRGHVCIEISDNGPGIPADLARKIFVPFFTTKRDGSGVGLALTRQVMISHGGTVTVTTAEKGGAKFTLTF